MRAHHDQLKVWLVEEVLTVVKAHRLLARRGLELPQRTLHRYALEELGVGRSVRRSTVRIADGEPGVEVQIDFGKMGSLYDSVTGRRRVCWALLFTAVYSRHCFVWLSFNQTIETLIDGCEAAWSFFGGVFKVVIPENVARNIFGVMWTGRLCGQGCQVTGDPGGEGAGGGGRGHIIVRARTAS